MARRVGAEAIMLQVCLENESQCPPYEATFQTTLEHLPYSLLRLPRFLSYVQPRPVAPMSDSCRTLWSRSNIRIAHELKWRRRQSFHLEKTRVWIHITVVWSGPSVNWSFMQMDKTIPSEGKCLDWSQVIQRQDLEHQISSFSSARTKVPIISIQWTLEPISISMIVCRVCL